MTDDERPIHCDDRKCPLHADGAEYDGAELAGGNVLPLERLRELAIRCALKAHGGSVIRAAKALGMGKATLYRFLAKR